MRPFLSLLLLLASSLTVQAGNWPAWRGPTGQGFCEDKLPAKWSKTENVKWKVPLADQGNSTPVIWGDRIFVTQANTGGTIRSLLCFAKADGKLLWQKDISYPHKEQNWTPNWYANASPAVDGERVIVSFASAGMYCFDFEGKELWKRTDLGHWEHSFGNASSPVLYGNMAILWCGPNSLPAKDDKSDEKPVKGKKNIKGARNFMLAVDKTNGKTIWEHDEKNGSWSTPIITKIDGQDQLLLSTVPHLKAFEPKTGKEIWWCNGLTKYVYTSPLYGNGVAVAMSGYHGDAFAVKVGGTGDITENRLWQQLEKRDDNPQRVGSGMIIGDHLYIVEEKGVPHCFELKTGKEVWGVTTRPSGDTWGSMIHSDGKLYVLMRNCDTLVFAASPEYQHLATHSLGTGEQTNSSLAVADGEVFIRTFRNLYCISDKK